MGFSSLRYAVPLTLAFMASAPVAANAACGGKVDPETARHNAKVEDIVKQLNGSPFGKKLKEDGVGEFRSGAADRCNTGVTTPQFYSFKPRWDEEFIDIYCEYAPLAGKDEIGEFGKYLLDSKIGFVPENRQKLQALCPTSVLK